ncbi:acyltransferase family protein [Mangrovibacter plantisponsor]|uniref:Putative membrane protein YcfT n=1 Tax=Mangrovibacter plantisponsor TaxID=451513 RepID=A0A317Q339_9ENTR|nr:acyltransferase family protein [Mangrovibacter plantisponsor]PWW09949.1 putative membrane protein YcfT [Mangrovibacter plantisponsor]
MKAKALWINQIKGLCICLVVIYHSVITFYPYLLEMEDTHSVFLAKCWVYLNLYMAPFRMPVFFFISGFLITRYINDVPWGNSMRKRIWPILYVLALWGVIQWLSLVSINQWLAPEKILSTSNAAYSETTADFVARMGTASTSLWYLYAMIVYFPLCKLLSRYKAVLLPVIMLISIAINFFPTPFWGMNSVIRNLVYYATGAWFGAQLVPWIKTHALRDNLLWFTAAIIFSFAMYNLKINLFLSLLSIVLIMRVFWLLEGKLQPTEHSIMNQLGTNTISIYTTHRIIIEALSLWSLSLIKGDVLSTPVILGILLVYPFISLAICTAVGMAARKVSQRLFSDILFTPPLPVATQSPAR